MPLPKPDHCKNCIGFGWGGGCGYSIVTGTGRIPLLVVAESSGSNEYERGYPLVEYAPSGGLFERVMQERGLSRADYRVTNIIRCQPPANKLLGMPYERAAIDHCRAYLDAEVAAYPPRAILALGDIALRELYGGNQPCDGVTAWRGYILPSRYGCPVIATYHPARLIPRRSRDGEAGNPGQMHLLGVLMRDVQLAVSVATNGPPSQLEPTHALDPTDDDIRDLVDYLLGDSSRPVAYDLETAAILGEKTDPDRIIQIQFSARAGRALVLPWNSRGIEAARTIFGLPNDKWDYNGRSFDRPLLRRHGIEFAGECHDLMWAFAHLQPSFMSNKEDGDDDKGVPARLMGLQSCASFYCPEVAPWKGMVERATADGNGASISQALRYYGALDADITYRCGVGLFASLQAAGLMAGYRSHKVDLAPVLDGLGNRGLPVDRVKQAELREYVVGELAAIQDNLGQQVPTAICSWGSPNYPKDGYKGLPKDLRAELAAAGLIVKSQGPMYYWQHAADICDRLGYEPRLFDDHHALVKRKPFNPSGSSPNTLAYIRHTGYRVPTQIDDPTKPTTGKLELQKLADETNDDVLRLVLNHRELRKTGMDYTSGFWVPGDDGRVHAEFRWGTASGQLTAVRPPVQTFPDHTGIAKRAKLMIAAERGHVLVKIDYRGAHARMAGWLAEDADYYRLTDIDVHSYIVAYFLQLPVAGMLRYMDDDELRPVLAAIKREHKHTRDYQVKRVTHGVTFGAKANKIYRMYAKELGSLQAAQDLIALLQQLFPKTFVDFPAWVREQIYHKTRGRLVSPFGHWRWFYDFDMEQATAFLPSNCFHNYGQLAMIRLGDAMDEYDAVNWTHDALWLHPTERQADECIQAVSAEMSRPSDVLMNSLGAFTCGVDVEVGPSLAEMNPYSNSPTMIAELPRSGGMGRDECPDVG